MNPGGPGVCRVRDVKVPGHTGAGGWAGCASRRCGEILFGNAPPADVDAAVVESGGSTPWTTWTEQITCVLIDAGSQRILVDTGAGALDPGTGRLVQGLAEHGVTPVDIDVVILTNGHPDHLRGLVDPHGSPMFPTARVLMSSAEWPFWTAGEAERVLPAEVAGFFVECARQALPAVLRRLELVDGDGEPCPGVRLLPAPGHTPGHFVVEVSSRGERLLMMGDLILHPLHVVHPEWHSVVDAEPALLRETRLAFFSRAADAECVVHACHLPFPGLGQIRATGSGHSWASSSFAPDEPTPQPAGS